MAYQAPCCLITRIKNEPFMVSSGAGSEAGVVNPDPWSNDDFGGSLVREMGHINIWEDEIEDNN